MTHWYFIEPVDMWMFRDSKPFAAGQAFSARSQFPPTPQTMQGVVRSNYLEAQNVDWRAYGQGRIETSVGTPSSLGSFTQFGPLVGRRMIGAAGKTRIQLLIPAPLDVVHSKTDKALPPQLLAPSAANFRTAAPFDGWRPLAAPSSAGEDLEQASGWMDQSDIERYIGGKAPSTLIKSSGIFAHEERVGLAMDHGRRTHRDQHLYHAQFVRPCPGVGLLVKLNGPYLDGQSIINIGGESRSGYCSQAALEWPGQPTSGNLRVVLLTPAFFSGGWQPANGDWSPWVGGGELVSTAIGRPQPISGWDVARNRPKPLNQYVPAGSVYYFKNAAWTGNPFTETPDGMLDHGAIGFGGALTANWNYVS